MSYHYVNINYQIYEDSDMDTFNAVGIAEGFLPCDSKEEYIKAWQYLIDNELLCGLQGSFGRTAQALIEKGVCHERKK